MHLKFGTWKLNVRISSDIPFSITFLGPVISMDTAPGMISICAVPASQAFQAENQHTGHHTVLIQEVHMGRYAGIQLELHRKYIINNRKPLKTNKKPYKIHRENHTNNTQNYTKYT